MVFAAWRVSALVLVTTLACRSKDGDMEDSSFVAPDPPDDGLLVLNVRVMDFDSGPAADALRVNFRLDQIQVEHRRLIEGELQPAEWFTVASGPAPLVIYQPEWDYPQFAGEFWLPPGEIQQVKIDLGNGKITDDSGTSALTFGDVPPGAASGTLTLTPQGPNLPNILPLAPTGLEIALPAGPGGVLYPEPTGYRLATTHPAHEVPNPERFPYAWDRLVVRYDSNADPVAVQAFEQSVGAERAYSNSTFDVHILEFEGTEWWGTVVNLMTFRRSPLVTFATLDPVLRPALHDTGLLNDPGYEDWQAGFLDDIDVETA
ncbi:MAG: hypothetical protein GY871_01515 [Actinomycetales bacterium]|nr:hypothetical protein [Actinomycetales bacterium]